MNGGGLGSFRLGLLAGDAATSGWGRMVLASGGVDCRGRMAPANGVGFRFYRSAGCGELLGARAREKVRGRWRS